MVLQFLHSKTLLGFICSFVLGSPHSSLYFSGQFFGPFDTLLMSNYLPISLLRHLGTQSQRKRGNDPLWLLQAVQGCHGALGSLCLLSVRMHLQREKKVHGMIRWLVSSLSRCCQGIFLSYYHWEICCILEQTNLTRKVEVRGPKINRSRKAAQGLARRTRARHWFVTLVFFQVWETRIWAHKIFIWKHLTIWRPVLGGFVQSTECLISDLHPELLSGDVKVRSLQWSWSNLCRGSWQVTTPSQQGPFITTYLTMLWGHFMAIVSCGPGKALSQVKQRFHWQAT